MEVTVIATRADPELRLGLGPFPSHSGGRGFRTAAPPPPGNYPSPVLTSGRAQTRTRTSCGPRALCRPIPSPRFASQAGVSEGAEGALECG